MVHCKRCSSRFHSARALMIENCPRCMLRDDVIAPLSAESAEQMPAETTEERPDPDSGMLDPEAGAAT